MNYINQTFTIKTPKRECFVDITQNLKTHVEASNLTTGQVLIYIPHTTAAVTINENADPDVQEDLNFGLNKFFPNIKDYRHLEGNSDAHLKSSLIGNTQNCIIKDGKLLLGTWQGVYLCEFDGPRNRQIHIQLFGVTK